MSQRKKILDAWFAGEPFDEDVKLKSDAKISFSRGAYKVKVDTVFLIYEPNVSEYPHFCGYAHNDNGGYDWDYLSPEEITNVDLDEYMQDPSEPWNITDLEGIIVDHPEIFWS